jgi:hypothetical protein
MTLFFPFFKQARKGETHWLFVETEGSFTRSLKVRSTIQPSKI